MDNIEMLGKFCDNKYIIGSNYKCKITDVEKEFKFTYNSNKLIYLNLNKKDVVSLLKDLKSLSNFVTYINIKNKVDKLILTANENNNMFNLHFEKLFELYGLENLFNFDLYYSIEYFVKILSEYTKSEKVYIIIEKDKPLLFSDYNKVFVLSDMRVD
jgi:hypothetical protein